MPGKRKGVNEKGFYDRNDNTLQKKQIVKSTTLKLRKIPIFMAIDY